MSNEEHKKIKEGIKSTFDTAADEYDTSEHFIISAKKFVELIELPDSKDIHILDISTGTGNLTIELAHKFPHADIHGVDISDKMLEVAKTKTKVLGIKNITFHHQDVEDLEFDNFKFDLIVCGYGLFFYPNMDNVFCDICSRLKDDGIFAFSTFTTSAFEPYSGAFLDMLEKDFDIKPPKVLKKRTLKTIDEIKELCSLVEYKNFDIKPIDIRYLMKTDTLWNLFNSAGYKGLLNQLGDNFKSFEQKYLNYLQNMAKDNYLEFNADSFITLLKIKKG
jgi:ubiquinone/menaquinone biosynthesis C-methylase UbiE